MKNEKKIAQYELLSRVVETNDFATVNSLRKDIAKTLCLMPNKTTGVYQRLVEIKRALPEPSNLTERISTLTWQAFLLWKAETLHKAGISFEISKQDKETFYRVASLSQKRRMNELLGA